MGRSREKLQPSAAIITLRQRFAVKRAGPATPSKQVWRCFLIAFSRLRDFAVFTAQQNRVKQTQNRVFAFSRLKAAF